MEYGKLGDWKYRATEGFTLPTGIIPPKPIKTHFSALDIEGNLTIDKGFCWDGATGAIDSENIMRGSCVHDAFCNWQDQGYLDVEHRKQADLLLKKIILEDGMSEFRAGYVYGAVQTYVKIRY